MALIKSCLAGGSSITRDSYTDTTSATSPNYTQTVTYTAPSGKTIEGIDNLVLTSSQSTGVAVASATNSGSSLTFTLVNYHSTAQTMTISCDVLLS